MNSTAQSSENEGLEGFQRLSPALWCRLEGALLFVYPQGEIGAADVDALLRMHGELRKQYGYVLVLYDGKHAGGMNAGARKASADLTKPEVMHTAAAVFNVGFTSRVMAGLVYKATRALSRLPLGPMEFFATEAEARAFLEQFRPKSSD